MRTSVPAFQAKRTCNVRSYSEQAGIADGEFFTQEVRFAKRDPAPPKPCLARGCHADCNSWKSFGRAQ